MKTQRTCRGCDGSGQVYVDALGRFPRWEPCLACNGAGIIEERIGVEDAVADAETLRREARATVDLAIDDFDPWANTDEHIGALEALRCYVQTTGREEWGQEDARISGHSAFRAVPGLRAQ